MAQRDRSIIKSALSNKGFQEKGGDHDFYIYYSKQGKKTIIKTKLSRGSNYKTYTDSLLACMASQCKLTKGEFLRLIDCTLSRDDYDSILSSKNLV